MRLVEPVVLGHGPLWLDYFATALCAVCEELTIHYPDHPAYADLPRKAQGWRAETGLRVDLEPIPLPEGASELDPEEVSRRASASGVDRCLITFLDSVLSGPIADALGTRSNVPEIWGGWFNAIDASGEWGRWLRSPFSQAARRDRHWLRAQANPPSWLRGAFFLDQAIADRVDLAGPKVVLPDVWPTRPRQSQQAARERLGLPLEPKLFLHFGVDGKRKGLRDAIDAWASVPPGAVLLRAGALRPRRRQTLHELEQAGRAIVHDAFVPEDRLDLYYRAVDWVLLPYRRHTGSSGVLAAAAAARRPVIVSEFGVLGRRVRDASLGELFEHGSPRTLARAVAHAFETPIERYAPALDAFAEAHSLPAFCAAFRSGWFG